MTVKPEDVPEGVLETLILEAPGTDARDEWRDALALTLTAWEGSKPPGAAHQCRWKAIGAKSAKIIGIAQTQALMYCTAGCGDLRTVQLSGEWTLEEVLRAQA